MCGEPGEQGGVFNTGLAPEVHDRELAGAQQSGKRLRADPVVLKNSAALMSVLLPAWCILGDAMPSCLNT